jgi:RTA1 like protein
MSSAKSASKLKLGEDVIIVGLIVQIIFFSFFVVVSVIFHKRMLNRPTAASMNTVVNWQRYMYILYFASVLIMIRCLYRVIEYIQGSTGTLQSHEFYAYIFDATLMFLVMATLLVFHPSQVLSREHKQLEETELMYGVA